MADEDVVGDREPLLTQEGLRSRISLVFLKFIGVFLLASALFYLLIDNLDAGPETENDKIFDSHSIVSFWHDELHSFFHIFLPFSDSLSSEEQDALSIMRPLMKESSVQEHLLDKGM